MKSDEFFWYEEERRKMRIQNMGRKKSYTGKFMQGKIGTQLNFIYLFAIFIPILAIGMFLIINTSSILVSYHRDLLSSGNASTRKILYEISTQIYNVSDSIAYDTRTIDMLGTEYRTSLEFRDAARNYTVIEKLIESYAQIGDITIYTDQRNVDNFKNFKQVTEDVESTEWYQKAISQYSPFTMLIVEPNTYKNMEYSIALVRKITVLGSDCNAVLVIKVSENYLESRLMNSDYVTLISYDDQQVFYSNKREYYGKEMPFEIDYEQENYTREFTEEFEDRQSLGLITSFNLAQSDVMVYIATLDKNAVYSITRVLITSGLIVLLALVLPALLMRVFTLFFTEQVDTLRNEMHRASQEDYDIQSDFSGSHELQMAYQDLLIMVQTIKEQKESMYEARISEQLLKNEQQEMEFKMLASQINPHFLYNTLEMLRMKAFTAGDREVANGIKLLGKMLRYVLVNIGTTYTSLKNELEHIETYIQIQKLRFGDRINYDIHIEDGIAVDEYMLLPLLLQPIVENSVIHGLENVDDHGKIEIHIYEMENKLLIDIRDNGNGMDAEQLENLRKGVEEDSITKNSSIGMSNIRQRIKLCYGDEYGLCFTSTLGVGTLVTVILPRYSVIPSSDVQ